MELSCLQNEFQTVFNTSSEATFFAPGRINLIGEHIDYNGGLVFPCAITLGTYGLVSKRSDKLFRVYSSNFKELSILEFSLDDLSYAAKHNWCNYLKGVLLYLKEAGHVIETGLNLLVFGNIPNGAGLSSSASLEMLMCKICADIYNLSLSPVEAALLGKQVENQYIGVNSGIMDQFAIALGKADSALLLNCNTQEYNYIPFKLKGYSILIMNTNKRRELADSKYNERRSECDTALAILQKFFPIHTLCDLSESQLEEAETLLNNPLLFKRVRHVVTENMRVIKATKALEKGDLITFGKLLNDSHRSLKEDYKVTGKELDTLAENARTIEGVLGARMTGAGFGGCSLAIVENTKIQDFISKLSIIYKEEIGYAADFYVASIGNGPIQLIQS
ncbi:galactokinase [Sporanaerobium hydrogeniformans]|uniref:Galactokinase n=1 Tax=Sporanaerobium hydrogeniformans TaxID=3072179 RepID=A0AC61DBK8_9FIRM|nr:galactokinase [Sporanaerobium hydrogeniformans]PHV70118.1 galactokinase [Sporanaerobium hydrogeniformans]